MVIVGILIVLSYFGVAWHLVGRDPEKNTISPTSQPPEGFCPAATHYLWTLGDITFLVAAALLSMAIKGFLTVEEPRIGMFCLRHTGKTEAILSPAEQAVAKQLFPHQGALFYLMRGEWLLFRKAERALKCYFRAQLQDHYFRSNIEVFSIGAMLSIVLIVWQFPFNTTSSDPFMVMLSTVGVGAFSYAGAVVVLEFPQEIKNSGVPGLLSLFIVGSALVLLYFYGDLQGTMTASISMAALALINAIFYNLLRTPTLKGREILDQMEGFRLFLEGREGNPVNEKSPPKINTQLFERYLPYAIVLGRENVWIRRFTPALSKKGKAPAKVLRWYRGDRTWDAFDHSFSDYFYRAIRITSTPPSHPS